MLGLISREIPRSLYLQAKSEARWVSLHHFFFEIYIIFVLFFFIYHLFIPECLTDTCLLCEDVGPSGPVDYVRNRRRP
jgi:hypothetical protein